MPRITADQHAKERSILLAVVADAAICVAFVFAGLLGGSFTILAEAIRGSLMLTIELFSLIVMRRIHRGVLSDYEFGPGKLEQVANFSIAIGMVGSAIWIAFGAWEMVLGGKAVGSPLGLAIAAIFGAVNTWINVAAWDAMRRAASTGPSVIMQAQLRARTVKLFSSLFIQGTMTVAAVSLNEVIVTWADAIGSAVVAFFIFINAIEMIRAGLPDLLDRTVEEDFQIAINRSLARHFEDYDHLDWVRSRRAGDVIFVEIALGFDGTMAMGEADRRAEALKATLYDEVGHADISILISPYPA